METMEAQTIERLARYLARLLERRGTMNIAHARNALAAKDRPLFVAAAAHAISHGYVWRDKGSDMLSPGITPPASTRLARTLVTDLDAALEACNLSGAPLSSTP